MNVSCTQQNFQKGLQIISRAITTRGSLPVLANVLLKTEKGRLHLIATDLEIAISTYIGAKVDTEGAITIPAKLLQEFVVTNSDPTILLETKDQTLTLTLTSARYSAHIKGINSEEFPLIPEVKTHQSFSLPALLFKQAVEQVVFASAVDETRPILTGVYMAVKAKEVVLAATDSYRLAQKRIALPKSVEKGFTVVIPNRAVAELGRIIDETIDMIEVVTGDNQIQFSFGSTKIISRLLEGKFPDYEQIIPQKVTSRATIATQDLANSIKMASFFARDVANNIKMKVNADGIVEVNAVSPQVGDTTSRLKATTDGESVEVAFNAKFLGDGLQALKDDNAIVELSGALSPGVLRPANHGSKSVTDAEYLYIVMPLKLDE